MDGLVFFSQLPVEIIKKYLLLKFVDSEFVIWSPELVIIYDCIFE